MATENTLLDTFAAAVVDAPVASDAAGNAPTAQPKEENKGLPKVFEFKTNNVTTRYVYVGKVSQGGVRGGSSRAAQNGENGEKIETPEGFQADGYITFPSVGSNGQASNDLYQVFKSRPEVAVAAEAQAAAPNAANENVTASAVVPDAVNAQPQQVQAQAQQSVAAAASAQPQPRQHRSHRHHHHRVYASAQPQQAGVASVAGSRQPQYYAADQYQYQYGQQQQQLQSQPQQYQQYAAGNVVGGASYAGGYAGGISTGYASAGVPSQFQPADSRRHRRARDQHPQAAAVAQQNAVPQA